MNSNFKFALGFLALVLLPLCNPKVGYAAPPTDACSLLTQAQVSAVLGVPVGPSVGPTAGPRWLCNWDQADASAPGRGKEVMLAILGTLGKLTALDRFNNAKKGEALQGNPKAVSGIGDDAVYVMESTGRVQLYVKKGAFVFKVRVVGFPLQQQREKEKTLALEALAKL